jgi:hypothetical protein
MSTQSPPRSLIAEILDRTVGPDVGDLSPEGARAILKLKLNEFDRRRAHELAVKNQEGRLTSDEEAEIEAYQRVGRLIDLLWAKARRSLRLAGLDQVATS